MIARVAPAYVRLLFVVSIMLFAAQFVLHVVVFISGEKKISDAYGLNLIRAVVVVGLLVMPFLKSSLSWMDQIKSCPRWMWKVAIAVGLYSLSVLLLQVIFPIGPSMSDQILAITGFPLGFAALYVCILYSVISVGYLDKLETISRVRHSVIILALCLAVIVAHRFGYFQNARTTSETQ